MARKNQRRKRPLLRQVPAQPVDTDPVTQIKCRCLICGELTGKYVPARASIIDPKDMAENPEARHGLCPEHQSLHDKGHTMFYSDTRGCVVNLEANKKLKPNARGGLWKIPEDKMDELLGKAS